VYAETDGQAGQTQIWMSNVAQLDKRKLLTSGTHKPSYGPGGMVSPDGSKLLYSLTPIDLSEKEALRGGNEIWILDIKSGEQKRVLDLVKGFVKWTPDSQSIVYSQNEYDDEGEVETKIYIMSISDLKNVLVFSINSYAFTFMDFLDTQTLLYLEEKSDTLTEIRILNVYTGETKLLQKIDVTRPWSSYSISPDNKVLLIIRKDASSTEQRYEIITVSLATGEKQTFLTYPYHQDVDKHPIYRLDARWLLNSQELLVHFPPQVDRSSYLGLVSVNKKASPQPFLDNASFLKKRPEYSNLETFLIMGRWSPDGKWLTLLQYPTSDRDVYLLEIATRRLTHIPSIDSSHWIITMGWIK
jgi:Tol biopolymer transport system component